MKENHRGELLLHVERAAGSRQDLCTEGCLAIYMNYPYYVEFLDEALRKKKTKSEQTSILQRNLFVVLTSAEMIVNFQISEREVGDTSVPEMRTFEIVPERGSSR